MGKSGQQDGEGQQPITPTPEELQELYDLRSQKANQVKPEQSRPKKIFKFAMPSSTVNIPTLKGASNWDRWYQTVYGCCQIAGIHSILAGTLTQPQGDEEYDEWESANSWIEGNIRMSLESGGHAHIAGIHGAHNMIKALEGAYKSKGYTSREVLWRTISRASLADYKGVTEYVEAIKKAKTNLAERYADTPPV